MYAYNKSGTQTRVTYLDPGRAYLYNRQNMLPRVEDALSNVIASDAYDALNRRIEKTVAGSPDVTTRFYYTASWQLIEETDAAAAAQRDYVWASGSAAYIDDLLLMRDVIGTSGTANADYFACRHHNFNVVAMLDNTGAVVERYDDNPYGKPFIPASDYTADADGISDVGMNIGPQGLMSDVESGLVYNRNRYLNLSLGRWMQRDPLGYVDGMSAYQYLTSDPVFFGDPLGFWGWDGDWIEYGLGGLLGLQGSEVAGAGWSEIDEGAAATADGFMPFFDPFQNYYADECGNIDPIYRASQTMGGISRDALIAAAGLSLAVRAGTGAKVVQVSLWGRPDLKPGDWVMRGPANVKNYIFSGKYQPSWMPGGNIPAPFSSGQSFTVPGSTLRIPPGFFGPLKSAIGQSIFVP